MARIILILGGARSGKSRFAQQMAERIGGTDVLFVATAEAGDDEMAERIRAHRGSRPRAWETLERTTGLSSALAGQSEQYEVVLIDCVTLLASNVLMGCPDPLDVQVASEHMRAETEGLLGACRNRKGTVIIVSSEVGHGLVPDYPLGRVYRDILGWTNQMVAAQADAVYLMVAGLAVEVKALARTCEQAATVLAPINADAGFRKGELPGEPQREPARSEPRTPGITPGRFEP